MDGTGDGVDGEVGIGVEATNKSGLPLTIRCVNKSLILRSSSVSIAFAIEERRALSCTFRNEFATVCKDLFNTTLLYSLWIFVNNTFFFSGSSSIGSGTTSANSAEPGNKGGRYPTVGVCS